MKTVRFISPLKSLRLVITSSEAKTKWAPEVKGKSVEFAMNEFETDDAEIIEWMENHPEYGIKFWKDGDQDIKKYMDSSLMKGVQKDPVAAIFKSMSPDDIKRLGQLFIEEAEKKGATKTEVKGVEVADEEIEEDVVKPVVAKKSTKK